MNKLDKRAQTGAKDDQQTRQKITDWSKRLSTNQTEKHRPNREQDTVDSQHNFTQWISETALASLDYLYKLQRASDKNAVDME